MPIVSKWYYSVRVRGGEERVVGPFLSPAEAMAQMREERAASRVSLRMAGPFVRNRPHPGPGGVGLRQARHEKPHLRMAAA